MPFVCDHCLGHFVDEPPTSKNLCLWCLPNVQTEEINKGGKMEPSEYGDFYWCVKVIEEVSPSREIYVHAQETKVLPDGSLCMMGKKERPVLMIASGKWTACYAASVMDGAAIAVQHWHGEVERA